jgi:hypothetical protein
MQVISIYLLTIIDYLNPNKSLTHVFLGFKRIATEFHYMVWCVGSWSLGA